MKAVIFGRHGPPDVLKLVDVGVPQPGPGQVRVRVRAGGVQPFDVGVRRGTLVFPVRFPQRLGNEFAGVVDRAGEDVTAWAPGDEVIGWAFMRSHAEFVVVESGVLAAKPAAMSWEAAGAISSSGQTAYHALRELGVTRGEAVLIHAAAGGAGTAAVQLARAWGARVLGTASAANHEYLRRLGATPITYGPGMPERVRAAAPEGVDAVLDGIGGVALRESVHLAVDRDRIGTLVDHDVAPTLGVRGIRAALSIAKLRELVRLHEAGALDVTVRSTFPLERIANAHRDVEHGHGRGKVVVTAA